MQDWTKKKNMGKYRFQVSYSNIKNQIPSQKK